MHLRMRIYYVLHWAYVRIGNSMNFDWFLFISTAHIQQIVKWFIKETQKRIAHTRWLNELPTADLSTLTESVSNTFRLFRRSVVFYRLNLWRKRRFTKSLLPAGIHQFSKQVVSASAFLHTLLAINVTWCVLANSNVRFKYFLFSFCTLRCMEKNQHNT